MAGPSGRLYAETLFVVVGNALSLPTTHIAACGELMSAGLPKSTYVGLHEVRKLKSVGALIEVLTKRVGEAPAVEACCCMLKTLADDRECLVRRNARLLRVRWFRVFVRSANSFSADLSVCMKQAGATVRLAEEPEIM